MSCQVRVDISAAGATKAAGTSRSRAPSKTALSSSRRCEALDTPPTAPPPTADSSECPFLATKMGIAGISMREVDSKSPHEAPTCAVVGAGLVARCSRRRSMGPPSGAARRSRGTRTYSCSPFRTERSPRWRRRCREGPLLGHCSGATGLEVFGAREAFSLHPLMSTPHGASPDVLKGAGAAIDGTSVRALATAQLLATRLGMNATRVKPEYRVADHAAGAIAANFLVALEACAERLAATAGITSAATRPARPRHGAAVGRARARAGADRPDRPRRRPHHATTPGDGRAAHPRASAAVGRAGPQQPEPSRVDGAGRHENDPDSRRDAGVAWENARDRNGARSAWCRPWAPSTPAITP